MAHPSQNHSDPAVEQAASWIVRLSARDLTAAEREEFEQWLLKDSRHSEEFSAQTSLWYAFSDIPSEFRASRLSAAKVRGNFSWRKRGIWSLAATLLLVIAVGGWFATHEVGNRLTSYTTGTGKTRIVTFPDGSVAYLNTRTRIVFRRSAQERRVVLVEGEVLFDVIHDAAHPFRVELGTSEIRVLGTRFNVYRKKDGEVSVTVLEGSVQVEEHGRADAPSKWQQVLGENQQLVYGPSGLIRNTRVATALDAVKWREGVLEIRDEPLPRVLDELTRYTDQRILMNDPRLSRARVAGTLTIRDVPAALARLEKFAPVVVTEQNGTYTLNYRSPLPLEESSQDGAQR